MRRLFLFLFGAGAVVMLAAVLPCFADEVAVLTNGFTIQHHRREVVGELTRLYISADGASFVDVPTADIDHYEEAPIPADPPPAKRANPAGAGGFPARPKTDLGDVVNQASGRYRLDPDLVNSVINAESGFNVRAVSPKGAQGLMQLMPSTAAQLGVPNAFDPEANVDGGTRYLRELLERYNFDLVKALAAYNAGPQRVEQFGGVPPYHETRAYVARIVKDFNKKKIAQGKAAPSTSQKVASAQRNGSVKNPPAKTQASTSKTHHAQTVAEAKTSSPSE
ncbi:MAG TPA: lytic transglycosylase domain-containing protein [Candidatus Acidoferrum sp.]|nr:lytic transglycosylase domain-containing protein [Candidatus Acidoferrum sp.]